MATAPVYSVAGFNQGVADWLGRLGNVWVEGELSELKRTDRWGLVYFCLKDDGAILQGSMQRERFDRIQPPPAVGDRVHAFGRGELWQRKGEFRFRAYAIEQFGLGQLLRRIEEVRLRLAERGPVRRRAQAAAAVPAPRRRARVRQRRRRQARRRRDGDGAASGRALPDRRGGRAGRRRGGRRRPRPCGRSTPTRRST